jgi:hypothetical protein
MVKYQHITLKLTYSGKKRNKLHEAEPFFRGWYSALWLKGFLPQFITLFTKAH